MILKTLYQSTRILVVHDNDLWYDFKVISCHGNFGSQLGPTHHAYKDKWICQIERVVFYNFINYKRINRE